MLGKLKEILFDWPDPDEKALEMVNKTYDAMLEEFKSLDYATYLRTKHWQYFQEQALKNACSQCQACNTASSNLSVHHKNNNNLGRETFNDVIVLCDTCRVKFSDQKFRKDVSRV